MLRASGVSFEDRQDLLGHRSDQIITHYSGAELQNLYEASNKVYKVRQNSPTLIKVRDYDRVNPKSCSGY